MDRRVGGKGREALDLDAFEKVELKSYVNSSVSSGEKKEFKEESKVWG